MLYTGYWIKRGFSYYEIIGSGRGGKVVRIQVGREKGLLQEVPEGFIWFNWKN